jgi:hypothetical protein
MPLFHFNSRTGEIVLPDVEGEDCPDLDTARVVALSSAQEALIEAIKFGDRPPDDIQITDKDGRELAVVPQQRFWVIESCQSILWPGNALPRSSQRHAIWRSGIVEPELIRRERRDDPFLIGHRRDICIGAGCKIDDHRL